MGDMTADMALNFDTVTPKAEDHIEVALYDAMHRKMCSRADSKTKIEEALHQVAGRRIRIDFVMSKNTQVSEATTPRLSRAQQVRELQENQFVKEAITTFDGAIADYIDPR